MKVFQTNNALDIVAEIIEMMENDTRKKVFTIRVLGETDGNDNAIDIIIVFKDECIFMGKLIAEKFQGKKGIRIQGDFI
jgi:hypothetical protein